MGVLINQGKQVDENEIIIAKDTIVKVSKVALHKTFIGALSVSFSIVDSKLPQYKNRVVTSTVTYDPNSDFSWVYLSLRRACGVPYNPEEPAEIDIEKLILNKCLICDLGKRVDKDGKEWQTCSNFKKLTDERLASMSSSSGSDDDGWSDTEEVGDDLPF